MEDINYKLQSVLKSTKEYFAGLSKRAWFFLAGTGVVLALGVFGFMVQSSSPGNLLYGVKVYVVENAFGLFQVTEEQQFNYGIDLLEERFSEVQDLSRNNELTDERMDALDPQFRTQVEKINELVNDENTPFDAKIDAKKIFNTTNHMVALINATGEIMDNSTERGMSEEFDEIHDLADTIQERQIERIVANSSNEEMIALIQEQLVLVTESMENQNQDTRNDVRELLLDTSRSISKQDFAEAFEHIGEAVQLLEIKTLTGLSQG